MDRDSWDHQLGIHDSSDEDEGTIAWFWERASGEDAVPPPSEAALPRGSGPSPPAAPAFREEGDLSFSPPGDGTDAAQRAEASLGRVGEDRERRSGGGEPAAGPSPPDAALAGWSSDGPGAAPPVCTTAPGTARAGSALVPPAAPAEQHLASAEDAADSVPAGTAAQKPVPMDSTEFASGLAVAPDGGSGRSPSGLGVPQSGRSSHSDSLDSWSDGGAEMFAALAPAPRPQGIEAWRVDSRYRLQREIGKGAYGEVAVAWDSVVRRQVAIKRLHGVFQSPEDIERVYREIFLLRRLRHSNVIRLHDVICDAGGGGGGGSSEDADTDLYLVFEYADTDLYHLLQSPQYLTADHVRTFLYQLAHAMRYMHARGTVHRDLKPANILVNEDCTLRVCDFGLARTLPAEEEGEEGEAPAAVVPGRGGATADLPAAPAPVPAPLPAPALMTSEGEAATTSTPPLPGGFASSSPAWDADAAAARGGGGPPATSQAHPAPKRDLLTVRDALGQASQDGGRHRRRRTRLRRGLTMHVVTRWYRAPEIVLQQEYGPEVDVWSAGCVFAELLGMQKGNARTHMSRRPLFPGGPTSQSELPVIAKDPFEGDQMATILSVLGTPDADTLAALPRHSRDMLKIYRFQPGRRLCDLYPGSDADALDLLAGMLRFTPSRRPSFEEVLRHPYFAGMRGAGGESGGYDDGGEEASSIEMPNVSECGVEDMRRLIMAEVHSVHSNAMVELAGNE